MDNKTFFASEFQSCVNGKIFTLLVRKDMGGRKKILKYYVISDSFEEALKKSQSIFGKNLIELKYEIQKNSVN